MAFLGRSRISENARVDYPDPHSPTNPRSCDRYKERLTPFRA